MNNIFLPYYTVSTLLMILMLWRYRQSLFASLIVLMAFNGVFAFWIPRGTQLLNIVMVLLSTYLVVHNKVWKYFVYIKYLIVAFSVYSVYFVLTNTLVHTNDLLLIFSQYSRYYVPFVCLLLFVYYTNIGYIHYYNHLWGTLLLIQILMSVYKYLLFGGHHWEGMVGTFGDAYGGGIGTGFPLVALCWVAVNSNMDIRKCKSWLFIAGLLFLGIATGKRAVILLFPILFMVLSVYVCKKKYSNRVWVVIAAAPLLFYFGVRLTPTFNPENKVWGTFDLEYMLNYTENYAMGEVEDGAEREHYTGRVGSALTFWKIFKDIDNYTPKTLFGEGLQRAYYTSPGDRDAYNQFGKDYGLNHRGDITGVLMTYIAIGMVGVILLVVYCWFLFKIIRYLRLQFVLYFLVMFDFIFYNFTIIRNPFVCTLMMFVIVYSLVQYSPQGKYSMVSHPYFLQ